MTLGAVLGGRYFGLGGGNLLTGSCGDYLNGRALVGKYNLSHILQEISSIGIPLYSNLSL